MTDKSDLWDINVIARVRFERVSFHNEVTLEEAIKLFSEGNFDFIQETVVDQSDVIEISGAEAY